MLTNKCYISNFQIFLCFLILLYLALAWRQGVDWRERQISCSNIWNFQSFSLSLQHRLLAHSWAAGGLIYEKDVFERLSLWVVNFANSNHHSRQMTTRRLRSTFLYIKLYSPCWRGLTALSILCDEGNAKAYYPRMGRETDTYAFFVYQKELKTLN